MLPQERALWFSGARRVNVSSMEQELFPAPCCSQPTDRFQGLLYAVLQVAKLLMYSSVLIILFPVHWGVLSTLKCTRERILRGAQSSRRFCAHFPPILTFPDPTLPRAPSYTIQFPQSTLFEPNIEGTIVFVRPC